MCYSFIEALIPAGSDVIGIASALKLVQSAEMYITTASQYCWQSTHAGCHRPDRPQVSHEATDARWQHVYHVASIQETPLSTKRTIVATNEGIAVAALLDAVDVLLALLESNVHVAVDRLKFSCCKR